MISHQWRCCLYLQGNSFSIHWAFTVTLHVDVAHSSETMEHISLHCPMTENFINSKAIWLPIIQKTYPKKKGNGHLYPCGGIKRETFDLCTTTVSSLGIKVN
jgi:hypothetical protein